MYSICYNIDTVQKSRFLSSAQHGRAASALHTLYNCGADVRNLSRFEYWWKTNWRSKNKESGAYQRPRPEQVVELWWEADEFLRATTVFDTTSPPPANVEDLALFLSKKEL